MFKKLTALALSALALLTLLSGCAPSPTALTVGERKVDAAEYAFYLYYNRTNTDEASGTVLYTEADTAAAREAALEQIVTTEVVLLKCQELGLELSEAQETTLARNKERLMESLGGKAAYLEYLEQTCLTDRGYDKFQANAYYYDILYTHMTQENQAQFTDEKLRQYFAGHYATVKYIYLSLLDDDGQTLDPELYKEKTALANSLVEQAQADDGDFDALMEQYSEDPFMTTSGIPISEQEARSTEYLSTLFDLEEGRVSDLITLSDGYYILKRCPIPASYYDDNQSDIYLSALDQQFSETLEGWKVEYPVTVQKIVDEIDLNNLREYIK